MRLTPRIARLTVAGSIVVLAVGLAGCADDDGDGESAGSVTSTTVGSTDVEAVVTTVDDIVTPTTDDVEITVEATSPSTPAPTNERGDERVVPEGFMAVTITVTRADGTTEEYCVWLSETMAQHQQGLMEVTDLDGAVGMLFTYDREVDNNFWMVDTPMPLSIAFFRDDGSYISATDMEPCLDTDTSDCERYSATDDYRYALEVPQGNLDDLGIGDGATVALQPATQTDACQPA